MLINVVDELTFVNFIQFINVNKHTLCSTFIIGVINIDKYTLCSIFVIWVHNFHLNERNSI